jgi:hypothetical protein
VTLETLPPSLHSWRNLSPLASRSTDQLLAAPWSVVHPPPSSMTRGCLARPGCPVPGSPLPLLADQCNCGFRGGFWPGSAASANIGGRCGACRCLRHHRLYGALGWLGSALHQLPVDAGLLLARGLQGPLSSSPNRRVG